MSTNNTPNSGTESPDSIDLSDDAAFANSFKELDILAEAYSDTISSSSISSGPADNLNDNSSYSAFSQENQEYCLRKIWGSSKVSANKRKLKPKPISRTTTNIEPNCPYKEINFKQLNRDIKLFVRDGLSTRLELEPMHPSSRRYVHQLAHLYGIRTHSEGAKAQRRCILHKTELTKMPWNFDPVDKLIIRAEKKTWIRDDTHLAKKGSKSHPTALASKPKPGEIVGARAKPLDETNLGNSMLRKLGWNPGEGLGATKSGNLAPISATVRKPGTGLGHKSSLGS